MATCKLFKLLLCGVGLSLLFTMVSPANQSETAKAQNRQQDGEQVSEEPEAEEVESANDKDHQQDDEQVSKSKEDGVAKEQDRQPKGEQVCEEREFIEDEPTDDQGRQQRDGQVSRAKEQDRQPKCEQVGEERETKEDVTAADSPPVWWQMIVDTATVILTALVCILAVRGEWFRSMFASPKLQVEPHNLVGYEARDEQGQPMIYYHLRVKNICHWAPAKGVRVQLKRYDCRGSGDFHEESVTIPHQFRWTPSETSGPVQTIADERIFDLGCLLRDPNGNYVFMPVWYSMPFRQDNLFVHAGEAVRYHLEIVGENFYCPETFGFEVELNGQWSDDLGELQDRLRITPL